MTEQIDIADLRAKLAAERKAFLDLFRYLLDEIEQLRAALAALDESPTERETPADEVTAPEVLKAVDDFRRIQDADFEHYDAALAGYLMAEFKITRRGGSR